MEQFIAKDFTASVTCNGYMLYYRNKPIGGAGTLPSDKKKHWRHAKADVAMYREDAEREIAHLVAGGGQSRLRIAIKKIQQH